MSDGRVWVRIREDLDHQFAGHNGYVLLACDDTVAVRIECLTITDGVRWAYCTCFLSKDDIRHLDTDEVQQSETIRNSTILAVDSYWRIYSSIVEED
ncbi:hypothetical protein GCM10025859_67420 [Alicyclobacillus fastidiosus]|nr:hypothetical protein GCM10025859_67420 [Alicyclobacillus fastidiosus]